MPIYEYQCEKCGHQLEALQKISDSPLLQCPACDEQSLQKLVSAASFRLKGGGWYETDFKTGDKRQLADSGSEDSGSKDSKAGKDTKSGAGSAKSEKPAESKSKDSSTTSKSSTKSEAKTGS